MLDSVLVSPIQLHHTRLDSCRSLDAGESNSAAPYSLDFEVSKQANRDHRFVCHDMFIAYPLLVIRFW
jgi:hypothetical protein